MTDIKQAISAAKAYATEILGNLDFLLEEVSSEESVFHITLSFTARSRQMRDSGKDQFNWAKSHADSREFKQFIVEKKTGTVSAMSIRQIA